MGIFSKKSACLGALSGTLLANPGCAFGGFVGNQPETKSGVQHASNAPSIDCKIVNPKSHAPELICGFENVRREISQVVELGSMDVECLDNNGSLYSTANAEVKCDMPKWIAEQDKQSSASGCMRYDGCEEGHLLSIVRNQVGEIVVIKKQ